MPPPPASPPPSPRLRRGQGQVEGQGQGQGGEAKGKGRYARSPSFTLDTTSPPRRRAGSLSTPLDATLHDALVGRGLKPYSLWLFTVGVPTLVLFYKLRFNDSAEAWAAFVFAGVFAAWTIPPETLGRAIVDFGEARRILAEIIPVLPVRSLPRLVAASYPLWPQLLPHASTVAPHLVVLLPHAEHLIRILPKITTSNIDDLIEILDKVAPKFSEFTPEHWAKLETILDDVLEKIDVLVDNIDPLIPVITDGLMVATPGVLKQIELVVPHLAALEQDLQWLLPFAEIEGVEELLPYLDKIAGRIHELEPMAQAIMPHLPKLKKILPDIADDLDVLMDVAPQTVEHLDPLLFWFGGVLPYVSKLGILRSSAMLRTAAPLAKLLPAPPPPGSPRGKTRGGGRGKKPKRPGAEVAEALRGETGQEWWRYATFDHVVTLPRVVKVRDTQYFVMAVDGAYAGEFRYKYVRELYEDVKHLLDASAPAFPPRTPFSMVAGGGLAGAALEERRRALEAFLRHVMADPNIVKEPAFERFIKVRRRWAEELPIVASPLLAGHHASNKL